MFIDQNAHYPFQILINIESDETGILNFASLPLAKAKGNDAKVPNIT